MVFPSCGSVLVIDDQLSEAMPLLNLLCKRHISAAYFNGEYKYLPDEPFDSVRLVFCDLRFNAAPDAKSAASTVIGILQKLISPHNGPYILLIWSTHESDYDTEVQAALSDAIIKPEFIIQLQKAEYFTTQDDVATLMDSLRDQIDKLNLDSSDAEHVIKVTESLIPTSLSLRLVPIEDALERIEAKLAEELKRANLFYLFVIWENTIGLSAIQTVNSIYSEIPETIPPDKRLRAMLFYLAYHRLEKQMDTADLDTKFSAAIESINEMLGYFYAEKTSELSPKSVGIDKIEAIQEASELTPARFNKWRIIESAAAAYQAGSVYRDNSKRFRFHGWIKPDVNTKTDKYNEIFDELSAEAQIQYIVIDLSSDCDIAQKKRFVARLVPGVLIPSELYKSYITDKKLKDGNLPESIVIFEQVEIDGNSWCIAFNLNQMFPEEVDKLSPKELYFGLTKSYVSVLKQNAATCVSKQGFEICRRT